MDNDDLKKAGDLFISVWNTARTAQRRDTLTRLRAACDFLVRSRDALTYRKIEEYCKLEFKRGPNAQTISNDKALRAYVESRKVEQSAVRTPRRNLGDEIDEITDVDLRSRMRILVAERDLAVKRLRIVTGALSRLHPPLCLDELLSPKDPSKLKMSPHPRAIPDELIKSLEKINDFFSDPSSLHQAGVHTDRGHIISSGLRRTLVSAEDLEKLRQLAFALRQ